MSSRFEKLSASTLATFSKSHSYSVTISPGPKNFRKKTWYWCSTALFSPEEIENSQKLSESTDWFAYPSDLQDKFNQAYNQGHSSLEFNIGLTPYRIYFSVDMAYHHPIDDGSNIRRVRFVEN
jgi:hypothetical protein